MRAGDPTERAAREAAVRQVAEEYLEDPNINSVGLGYRVKGGRRTRELVLQFTVEQKVAPESLEAVTRKPIPDAITAPNGLTFRTDVLERGYRSHPVAVEVDAKSERKRRQEPMMPGISIGNAESGGAGTLGCVVLDGDTGRPRVLTNWHVLHGPDGALGDAVAQPGPFDDNSIDGNVCGRLVRSFVGLAGDCALATVSRRAVTEEALGLGVAVRRVGEPELGDRVVKSGRTSGVTHGIVTQIHQITKMTYGTPRTYKVGGFEIGPDPRRRAPNGEISESGDSGSAWMAADARGRATDMMLGLHFAGEAGGDREFALACYASSVFDKLEVRPLPPLARPGAVRVVAPAISGGFDLGFLPGHRLELPVAGRTVRADYARTRSGELVRHYTHFSLAMSARRRFCRWVAWNIDGAALKSPSRKGIDFRLDPEYDARFQIDNRLYTVDANPLDRGHIARREDLLWGSLDEAKQANVDSFFFTNITPQLDTFNQSSRHGDWGELENAIFADVRVDHMRLSLFGGPILDDSGDFRFQGVLVPRSFWKAIAYVEGGELKAKAFVLTQADLEVRLESLGLEPFKLFQVSIAKLAGQTGLDFGALAAADTMAAGAPEALTRAEALAAPDVRRIRSRAEIVAEAA